MQVEDQRFFHQQGESRLDDPERRLEVTLVRQADGHQVRPLPVEHLLDVQVAGDAELGGPILGALRVPADDGAQLRIGPGRERDGMLAAPPGARADDGDTHSLGHASPRADRRADRRAAEPVPDPRWLSPVWSRTTSSRNTPLTTCW